MFIAAKFEEIVSPSVSNFRHCADASYTEAEILQAERYVLKTLDWNLSYPNPVHYLRRVSKADDYNVKVRTLAKYLLEIGCLEWRLLAAPPSLMAAAAIWLARMALGMEVWTPNLAHYSSYPESSIIPTANLMLNYILKPIQHESFYKKYAGKRYFKSSVYIREWVFSRWSEGTRVNLARELPRIKAEIKVAVKSGTEIFSPIFLSPLSHFPGYLYSSYFRPHPAHTNVYLPSLAIKGILDVELQSFSVVDTSCSRFLRSVHYPNHHRSSRIHQANIPSPALHPCLISRLNVTTSDTCHS